MISDAYASFRRLPLWVQIWVAAILVPVNLASALFLQQPGGVLVAILAIGGMTPNAFLIFYERGFSKAMSLSHLVFWIPLLPIIWSMLGSAGPFTPAFVIYLKILFAVNLISLLFDIPDSWKWFKGDRAVP